MTTTMITQNLNTPCELIVDANGFLNLIPLSPEDVVKAAAPVPCHPGVIVDHILSLGDAKKFKGRDLLVEYTEYTNPWRVPGSDPLPEFHAAAQQWLNDNHIAFDVMLPPANHVIGLVNVHLNDARRIDKGECKYAVTFGDTWLFRRMEGKLPDGKPNEAYNLEGLLAAGQMPPMPEGVTVPKTNALGVQCARLYLNAVQSLSTKKETTDARVS